MNCGDAVGMSKILHAERPFEGEELARPLAFTIGHAFSANKHALRQGSAEVGALPGVPSGHNKIRIAAAGLLDGRGDWDSSGCDGHVQEQSHLPASGPKGFNQGGDPLTSEARALPGTRVQSFQFRQREVLDPTSACRRPVDCLVDGMITGTPSRVRRTSISAKSQPSAAAPSIAASVFSGKFSESPL